MSPNEATVRAYVAAFNAGDFEALEALFTPDATIQGVLADVPLANALPIWRELHDGMAMTLSIEAIAESGDQVAVRYRENGRFVGPFRGLAGVQPTGRGYEIVAMEWFELAEGRIRRRWGARDSASISRQVLQPEQAV